MGIVLNRLDSELPSFEYGNLYWLPGAIVVDRDAFTRREMSKINSMLHSFEAYIQDTIKKNKNAKFEKFEWVIYVYITDSQSERIGPIGQNEWIALDMLPCECCTETKDIKDVVSVAINDMQSIFMEYKSHGVKVGTPFVMVLSDDDIAYRMYPEHFLDIYNLNATGKIRFYSATRYGEYPEHIADYFFVRKWRKPLPLSSDNIVTYLNVHAGYSAMEYTDNLSRYL